MFDLALLVAHRQCWAGAAPARRGWARTCTAVPRPLFWSVRCSPYGPWSMGIFFSWTGARPRAFVSPLRSSNWFDVGIGTQGARGAAMRTCQAVAGERHAVKDYFPVSAQTTNNQPLAKTFIGLSIPRDQSRNSAPLFSRPSHIEDGAPELECSPRLAKRPLGNGPRRAAHWDMKCHCFAPHGA